MRICPGKLCGLRQRLVDHGCDSSTAAPAAGAGTGRALDILDTPCTGCCGLEDLVSRRAHAGTDEALFFGARAAAVVACPALCLFTVMMQAMRGSTIHIMEVPVAAMREVLAVCLFAAVLVAMEVRMSAFCRISLMVMMAMVSGFASSSAVMVVPMMSGCVCAVVPAMDGMSVLVAVSVARSLSRLRCFGIAALGCIAGSIAPDLLVRRVAIHGEDSFL